MVADKATSTEKSTLINVLAGVTASQDNIKEIISKIGELIESGADVNGVDINTGEFVWIRALRIGNFELVKLLLDNGASTTLTNGHENLLSYSMIPGRDSKIFDLILQHMPFYPIPITMNDYFFQASLKFSGQEQIEWIKKLHGLGIKLDSKNPLGENFLDYAIKHGVRDIQDVIRELSVKEPYSSFMPGWYYNFHTYESHGFTFKNCFSSLVCKYNLWAQDASTLLNPSRYKKFFDSKEDLDQHIVQVKAEFDHFFKFFTLEAFYTSVYSNLNQLSVALQNTDPLNQPAIDYLQQKIQLDKRVLGNADLLRMEYQKILGMAKGIQKYSTMPESTIYEFQSQDNNEEFSARDYKINHRSDQLRKEKTKVLVIDFFIKDDTIEKTTFNCPDLDDLVASTSLKTKYEATSHAAHVSGIIKKYSINSVEFDCAEMNDIQSGSDFPNARLVNMSIGFKVYNAKQHQDYFLTFFELCEDKIVVKSIGNESSGVSGKLWLQQFAKHPELHQNMILVSSHVDKGFLSPFSNIPGNSKLVQKLAVSVPANMVSSCIPIVGEEKFAKLCPNMEYTIYGSASFEGTSVAAPMVTGLAAFMIRKFPELSNKQIVEIIRGTCTQTNNPELYGNGYVNFEGAITKAEELHAEIVGDQQIDEEGQ